MSPLVSIILPTFNRARFLPDAFQSIRGQSWRAWELIVVDDGSTDDTHDVVEQALAGVQQPVQYVRRENGGAYAARNTGLDHASGDYVAFFDSDDLWLPQYLERCVTALEGQRDVDWVYAACRLVDGLTERIIAPSTFHARGKSRAFLNLPARRAGALRMLDGRDALDCQLTSGLYAGLQNSVIRREVFQADRFWDDYRVVEDVLFLVRALSRGVRIGYIDEVLVVYRVHEGNSSASATGANAARLLPIFEEEVRGLERLRADVSLPADARATLRRELGRKYFWRLGYLGYWRNGQRDAAFQAFRAGMRLTSPSWRMLKTYALCRLRAIGRT